MTDKTPVRKSASRRQSWPRKVLDLLLCAVAATALLGAVLSLAIYTHSDSKALGKWVGFGGTTAIVFVDGVRVGRQEWTEARFWVPFVCCLVLQVTLGSLLLQRLSSVPVMIWAFFLPADYIVVAESMAFIRRSWPDGRRKR